jgi:cell volume regulation protein A
VLADIPGSLEFFNIVFFAVLFSTLLQGSTVEPLARRLGLMDPQSSTQPSATAEAGAIRELGANVVEFTVAETDPIGAASPQRTSTGSSNAGAAAADSCLERR